MINLPSTLILLLKLVSQMGIFTSAVCNGSNCTFTWVKCATQHGPGTVHVLGPRYRIFNDKKGFRKEEGVNVLASGFTDWKTGLIMLVTNSSLLTEFTNLTVIFIHDTCSFRNKQLPFKWEIPPGKFIHCSGNSFWVGESYETEAQQYKKRI